MEACDIHREHLSAEIDGELASGTPAEARAALAAAHEHLDGCAACTAWLDAVLRLNRLVGVAPADPGPGLSQARLDQALTRLPRRRTVSGRTCARVALGVVGVAQTVLGALSLGAPSTDMHAMPGMAPAPDTDVAGMLHMSHEYAAWNLALGLAFVVGALWTRHLAGTLPVLAGFVGVLAVLSGIDLVHGDVDAARVVSHALVVVGLVLVAVIVLTGSPRPRWRPWAETGARAGARTGGGSAGGITVARAAANGVQARDRDAA
jgi:predicted anti-sigma-YlaC factor YlaD